MSSEVEATEFYSDVLGCARCGGRHGHVLFRRFDRHVIVENGKDFEFWGTCPQTDEPILMHREFIGS